MQQNQNSNNANEERQPRTASIRQMQPGARMRLVRTAARMSKKNHQKKILKEYLQSDRKQNLESFSQLRKQYGKDLQEMFGLHKQEARRQTQSEQPQDKDFTDLPKISEMGDFGIQKYAHFLQSNVPLQKPPDGDIALTRYYELAKEVGYLQKESASHQQVQQPELSAFSDEAAYGKKNDRESAVSIEHTQLKFTDERTCKLIQNSPLFNQESSDDDEQSSNSESEDEMNTEQLKSEEKKQSEKTQVPLDQDSSLKPFEFGQISFSPKAQALIRNSPLFTGELSDDSDDSDNSFDGEKGSESDQLEIANTLPKSRESESQDCACFPTCRGECQPKPNLLELPGTLSPDEAHQSSDCACFPLCQRECVPRKDCACFPTCLGECKPRTTEKPEKIKNIITRETENCYCFPICKGECGPQPSEAPFACRRQNPDFFATQQKPCEPSPNKTSADIGLPIKTSMPGLHDICSEVITKSTDQNTLVRIDQVLARMEGLDAKEGSLPENWTEFSNNNLQFFQTISFFHKQMTDKKTNVKTLRDFFHFRHDHYDEDPILFNFSAGPEIDFLCDKLDQRLSSAKQKYNHRELQKQLAACQASYARDKCQLMEARFSGIFEMSEEAQADLVIQMSYMLGIYLLLQDLSERHAVNDHNIFPKIFPLFQTGLYQQIEADSLSPVFLENAYLGLATVVLVTTLVKTIRLEHLPAQCLTDEGAWQKIRKYERLFSSIFCEIQNQIDVMPPTARLGNSLLQNCEKTKLRQSWIDAADKHDISWHNNLQNQNRNEYEMSIYELQIPYAFLIDFPIVDRSNHYQMFSFYKKADLLYYEPNHKLFESKFLELNEKQTEALIERVSQPFVEEVFKSPRDTGFSPDSSLLVSEYDMMIEIEEKKIIELIRQSELRALAPERVHYSPRPHPPEWKLQPEEVKSFDEQIFGFPPREMTSLFSQAHFSIERNDNDFTKSAKKIVLNAIAEIQGAVETVSQQRLNNCAEFLKIQIIAKICEYNISFLTRGDQKAKHEFLEDLFPYGRYSPMFFLTQFGATKKTFCWHSARRFCKLVFDELVEKTDINRLFSERLTPQGMQTPLLRADESIASYWRGEDKSSIEIDAMLFQGIPVGFLKRFKIRRDFLQDFFYWSQHQSDNVDDHATVQAVISKAVRSIWALKFGSAQHATRSPFGIWLPQTLQNSQSHLYFSLCSKATASGLLHDIDSNYLLKMQVTELYRHLMNKFTDEFVFTQSLITKLNKCAGAKDRCEISKSISRIEKNDLIEFQKKERAIWRTRRLIHKFINDIRCHRSNKAKCLEINHLISQEQILLQEIIDLAQQSQTKHLLLVLAQKDHRRLMRSDNKLEKSLIGERLKILYQELEEVSSIDQSLKQLHQSVQGVALAPLVEAPLLVFSPRLFKSPKISVEKPSRLQRVLFIVLRNYAHAIASREEAIYNPRQTTTELRHLQDMLINLRFWSKACVDYNPQLEEIVSLLANQRNK